MWSAGTRTPSKFRYPWVATFSVGKPESRMISRPGVLVGTMNIDIVL